MCDCITFVYDPLYRFSVIFMLVLCTCVSLIYSFHYFSGDNKSLFLSILMINFSIVMLILVISNSLLFSLIMWEYLGFVRYLLILFYDRSVSLRGAIITLVSSRFGDIRFFMIVSMMYIGGCGTSKYFWFSLLVLLVIYSKRALFPFISWLLEAMRAPTPVSSLVHSSTLVAAGVWFLGRYYYILSFGSNFYLIYLLECCCILTIFITSMSALFFNDLKKIVALSTCNKISWVLLVLVFGDLKLSFIHLLVHAIRKCLLFTLVGDYISSSLGGQVKEQVYTNIGRSIGRLIYIFVLLVGLSGFPFIGLYFSKHLFLTQVFSRKIFKVFFLLLVLLGFILSCAYCVRLFVVFFRGYSFSLSSIRVSFSLVFFIPLIRTFLCYYLCYDIFSFYIFTNGFSLLILFIYIIGGLLGIYVINVSYTKFFRSWVSSLFGVDYFVYFFNHLVLLFGSFVSLFIFRWELYVFSSVDKLINLFKINWLFKVSFFILSLLITMLILIF